MKKITIRDIQKLKGNDTPFATITAYDYVSARNADAVDIPLVLVGDSAAMVVYGMESTIPISMDELIFLTRAVSRGAQNVTFCENYSEAIKILKINITNLKCHQKTQIITKNIFNIKNLNQFHKKKFEIIFLDPPYKEKKLTNLLDDILSLKLLKNNGIIIIHRHKKEEEIYPKKFKILKIKTYGISKIIFGN